MNEKKQPSPTSSPWRGSIVLALLVLLLGINILARIILNRTKTPITVTYRDNPVQEKSLDINEATLTEFSCLRGIGPVKAQSIIDYRKKHKGFTSLEELKQVKGFGEKTFALISGQLRVSP